jgi:hypothetical protein
VIQVARQRSTAPHTVWSAHNRLHTISFGKSPPRNRATDQTDLGCHLAGGQSAGFGIKYLQGKFGRHQLRRGPGDFSLLLLSLIHAPYPVGGGELVDE